MAASIEPIGRMLRINQSWRLFSSGRSSSDGWFVISAERVDGTTFDVLSGNDSLDWRKPAVVSEQFPDQRWRKYMDRLRRTKNDEYRLQFGRYITRTWNTTHQNDDRIVRFQVYFITDSSEADSEFGSKKRLVWNHRCFKEGDEPDPNGIRNEESKNTLFIIH